MSYAVLLGLIIALSLVPVGLTGLPTAHSAGAFDYKALVEGLKRTRLKLEEKGDIRQSFFSVQGRVIGLDGEDVQVFEYRSVEAAQADATKVSPSGSAVRTVMVTWLGPPHFYRRERIIALYVGDTSSVKQALESVLGLQFAGR
jgi:hypothetical protein